MPELTPINSSLFEENFATCGLKNRQSKDIELQSFLWSYSSVEPKPLFEVSVQTLQSFSRQNGYFLLYLVLSFLKTVVYLSDQQKVDFFMKKSKLLLDF